MTSANAASGARRSPSSTRRPSPSTGTLRDYDGEPLLAKLDGPHTLFIDGQYDEARPVTLGAFAARVPGAGFAVVPNAAHGFFNDRPEEALGILRPWLREQDPR